MPNVLPEPDPRLSESQLIARAISGEEAAFRTIIQANNRRLYRVARSVVRDDQDAEDVLQEAYLRAFTALASFKQESKLSTWLTRIVLNEALQHVRRRKNVAPPQPPPDAPPTADIIPFPQSGSSSVDPERAMAQGEICKLLEHQIDALPDEFRTVLIARTLEGLSIEETAELLDIRPETVKTRLHRARQLLKAAMAQHIESTFADVFPFDGQRCHRMTTRVLQLLKLGKPQPGT